MHPAINSVTAPTDAIQAVLLQFLPITALVALTIFVAREIIAAWRIAQSRSRKLKAYKRLIANEIVLNKEFLSFARKLGELFDNRITGQSESFKRVSDTVVEICVDRPDKGTMWFRSAYRTNTRYEQLALEIAELDMKTFDLVYIAYSALESLESTTHLLNDLVGEEPPWADALHSTMGKYFVERHLHAHDACSRLYEHCMGKPLPSEDVK